MGILAAWSTRESRKISTKCRMISAVVAFALNKIGENIGDALSFWRTQSDTTASMATTSTQPCSGTYNGASFKDNDKGIDYTSKSNPCFNKTKFEGSNTAAKMRDDAQGAKTVPSKTTAIQCGGSNGPTDCNFTNVTIKGFGTGIYDVKGSNSSLDNTTTTGNDTGVYKE
jgi:hypothetical protein